MNGTIPRSAVPWFRGSQAASFAIHGPVFERVQLVQVTRKRVQQSRRTEGSIQQRIRPNALNPKAPDDR
jgi:hypothetical protein